MSVTSAVDVDPDIVLDELSSTAEPWQVIVWNDPVNLMSYVTYVFRTYFGFSSEVARRLMLQVHHEGKAVVAKGTKEEAERHVAAMHGYGLWATYEQNN
jgi:ATP-dependent Clp protease adaptor protein ClpS